MNLNVLVRGQSNSIQMMESNNWAGYSALHNEVQRLLGFDGVNDTVSLVYERYDPNSSTAFGGTALIGDWLNAKNGDWHQGWNIGGLEQSLLNRVNSLSAGQKDDPTATLWMHSEYDSTDGALTAEQWMSAVRFDAAQVREALGQGAETTPYLFVSAMPYWGTASGHNAIREGMERLAADPGFNADIAARVLDSNIDNDNIDNNASTRDYGGPHMDPSDAMQAVMRAARSIAENFADHAKPGSPVALAGGNFADAGPQVIHAELVGSNQLRVDVAHDGATSFHGLDADAANGVGWSVMSGGNQVNAQSVSIVDGDSLLITFAGPVAATGTLYYGYGYGRLAGSDGSGQGNAVYDNQGLPIWVAAEGLKIGTTVDPVESGLGAPVAPAPGPAPVDPTPGGLNLTGTAAADTLAGKALGDTLDGKGGDDVLRGGGGHDTLLGGDGDDRLLGGAGDDVLNGGAGNDLLRGNAGKDVLTTGAGVDKVVFGAHDGADRVTDFAVGTDKVQLVGVTAPEVTATVKTVGGVSGLELHLASGDTLFLEGVGNVTAKQLGLAGKFAGEGTTAPAPSLPATTNTVTGGTGDDWLKGGAGADKLVGNGGADDLQGLGGADVLQGGRGDDGLTGGAGADTFVFARGDGADWVVDFQPGVEKVWLQGITAGEVTQTLESRWGMPGLELAFGGGDEMFLEGVTQKVAVSDMIFA